MFTGLDVSLAREHNAGLLRESSAYRLGTLPRSNRESRHGRRRAVIDLVSRGFATPSASGGLAVGEETMPKEV
jgi:hypothetical protein